ncbi:peptidoglycan-binding protein LysM [Desemzia sp. RIT804]|uniref:3D domain-containing protein n=1 Tax=Desemzia sp. RIT 804 TaxID=2810209 RepID=UPI00195291B1|nr:3D domain-containing protein [Desemzia sp. RIT 804]MBM6614650.1 peptidoglycan-binding protein LysM [Desemzia sp. RIT 804]
MKKRTISFCLVVGMMISVFSPIVGEAATLEEIKIQQQSKQSEMILLDNQINSKLEEVNKKNAELEVVEEEITSLEAVVEETAQAIEEQEAVVAERLDQAKERLKTIQTNEVNQNTVLSLIEAENVTDFLNRAYVLITLQSAGNDQVESAQEEADELEKLEEQHAAKITELKDQSLLAKQQKEAVATELASLQETMDENKALLDKLDEERANEENRIAEEKERLAKEEAEKAEQAEQAALAAEKAKEAEQAKQEEVAATQTSTKEETAPVATNVTVKEETKTTEAKTEQKVETKTEAQPTPEKTASSSKTVVVSATGYSTQQAGLSTHTAMGIDLTVNPNVIAVDPSVIPLGSKVEIPGFGVFIAGDTGGAIKGNKIDIHFSTVQQALSWGRRTITVKILD